MHSIRALAIGGLLALLGAAPAAADSIAYVKDNNIWLASPDGSRQVQITHDGSSTAPYRSPSQADDGTIAAAHGGDLVRLAQTGQVLAQFAPPTATDSAGTVIEDVPQQVAISPDGTRLAYVYSQPSCPPGAPCGVRQVLLYSSSDHTTPVATFGEQTNLTNPSWIDNDRVLAFGGHFRQVNLDSPGGGNDDALHWFDDAGNEDVGDGELSRQGDRLALVRSYGDHTHLAIYQVSGIGGSAPEAACFTGTDASLAGPSWSPDGTKLAFQDSEGIEVISLPSVIAGDCPGAASSTVVLGAGATAPDWGPAAIRPDAGTYTGPHDGTNDGPNGGPHGGPQPPAPSSPEARLSVSLPRTVSLRTASGPGIVIRAGGSVAGRISASLLVGRRAVGAAGAPVTAGGSVTLRLKPSPPSLRLVRRRHVKRLTITVTLTPATGGRVTRAATARITGKGPNR